MARATDFDGMLDMEDHESGETMGLPTATVGPAGIQGQGAHTPVRLPLARVTPPNPGNANPAHPAATGAPVVDLARRT